MVAIKYLHYNIKCVLWYLSDFFFFFLWMDSGFIS